MYRVTPCSLVLIELYRITSQQTVIMIAPQCRFRVSYKTGRNYD
jgi:hypothetical protein